MLKSVLRSVGLAPILMQTTWGMAMSDRPAPNTREAQIARVIAAAQAQGLTIYAIEMAARTVKLVTAPALPNPPAAANDAAGAEDAWDRALGLD